jgi:hypothetical protein
MVDLLRPSKINFRPMRCPHKVEKMKKLTYVLVLLALLSGCKTDMQLEVFSSDIFLPESVKSPAQLAVEISSCSSKDLDKQKAEILSLFSSSANAKAAGCERREMTSMLLISFDAEIASTTSTADVILFRGAHETQERGGKSYETRVVTPVLSKEFLQRVKTLMSSNMQRLTYDKFSIAITINNDERRDINFQAFSVWVDGEPYDDTGKTVLRRRDKVQLRYSNVFSDLVLRGKRPSAIYVERLK